MVDIGKRPRTFHSGRDVDLRTRTSFVVFRLQASRRVVTPRWAARPTCRRTNFGLALASIQFVAQRFLERASLRSGKQKSSWLRHLLGGVEWSFLRRQEVAGLRWVKQG